MGKRVLACWIMSLGVLSACAGPEGQKGTMAVNANEKNPAYADLSQNTETRARDLLKRLTLEEKISLLHGDGQFSTAALARFNIPKHRMSDGPQGVREEINSTDWGVAEWTNDFSTALPAGVGLAATFNIDLAKSMGDVIGEEALARGKHIMLGPGVNIMRTPLNGRNAEYFGEDPFLASRMTVGVINAVQSHGVASCVKHFGANNQEFMRNSIDVEMDDRTLHEIYLPAFKAAVTESKAWCVMAAYNRFRGDFCSENDLLLNQILKKDWSFQGLVMSDWGGAHSTVKAAQSGLDLEMGSNGTFETWYFAKPLLDAVKGNQVSVEKIDEMALRNLRVMVASGVMDPPERRPKGSIMTAAHATAARKIAEEACVLLKNDKGALPLDATKIKSIAVIGDIAKQKFAHEGNSATIKTSHEVTPLEGITKRAGEAVKVTYVQGYAPPVTGRSDGGRGAAVSPAMNAADEAVAAASKADVAVVCAGLYRGFDQEGADRQDMKLPAGQAELIARVSKANPRTIVVLTGGGPLEMDPWIDQASGVLFYWYGGTEGGTALARVLFGDVNPSGKLPCTFPKVLADSPAHTFGPVSYPGQQGKQEYAEGLLVGYRWFDTKKIEPQFPFGFGLSYTTFEFDKLTVKAPSPAQDRVMRVAAMVNFELVNKGSREGAEVAQVYVRPLHPSVARPDKELKAFRKIVLKPGERKRVTLELPDSAFAFYDAAKRGWVAEAGEYEILVGSSSRELPLKMNFKRAQTMMIRDAISPLPS